MARGERDPEKERYWRGILKQQEASGMNAKEFCRVKGINDNNFFHWRREIAHRDAEKPAAKRSVGSSNGSGQSEKKSPSFIPVEVNPPEAEAASLDTPRTSGVAMVEIRFRGHRLQIPESVVIGLLRVLLDGACSG